MRELGLSRAMRKRPFCGSLAHVEARAVSALAGDLAVRARVFTSKGDHKHVQA